MKYIVDEMLEKVPEFVKEVGIECFTVHEGIVGTKQKTRKIEDWEVRRFLIERRSKGEEITLITNDENSCKQIRADGLPVLYVPELIRDFLTREADDVLRSEHTSQSD